MQFTKRLRPRIERGEITCSVRIWMQPHVKVGGRYRLGEGAIVVDAMCGLEIEDITPELARRSGFDDVADLLKIARHGRGSQVYLVTFHYEAPPRGAGA